MMYVEIPSCSLRTCEKTWPLLTKGRMILRPTSTRSFVEAGLDVPSPQPDPIDEVRSDAGENAPTTLDLQAAGITSVIWANGYGFDYSWVHLPVLDLLGISNPAARRYKVPGPLFPGHETASQPQVGHPVRRRRGRGVRCRQDCLDKPDKHLSLGEACAQHSAATTPARERLPMRSVDPRQ